MAILSADKQYVTVQKGDSLWAIANEFLNDPTKAGYQKLGVINGKTNPYYIYVGEKIYLYSKPSSSGSGSGSGSSTTTTSSQPTQVTIKAFGLQADTDDTLFVTWDWSRSKTASYSIEWSYYTSNGIWFISSSSNSVDENNPDASRQSTYSIPSNALQVRVRIKPIAKKETVNNKETTPWTASWSSYKTWTDSTTLSTPGTPSVEIEDYKLTAKLENITVANATQIEFQIYKNDGSSAYKTGKATITATKTASYSCTVDAGGEYKVRCRAIGSNSAVSEWSPFSSGATTIPAASSGITVIKANSDKSIYLEWTAADTAKTYDVEYTTKETYFDGTDQTTVKTGIEFTHFEFVGLEPGQEYFFRVRAVNDKGHSGWSAIKSITIGKKPTAPTTWSSTTTAISGEKLILYWVHNAEDNSSQTYAELEIYISGVKQTHTIKNSEEEEEKDKTSFYEIDTTSYAEGTTIQWRVRTAGITKEYGDWSVQRTINIYAPPTLELNVTDVNGNAVNTLRSFPLYIYGLPGPNTQTPMSYHLTVSANESYETTDNVGNEVIVSQGDEVYSQYFDVSQALLVELMPSDINLDNNITYTVTCVVSMDSGLTASESREFTVAWTDEVYTPNAEISYDPERYVTHIRPYCVDHTVTYYKVNWASDRYTKTTEEVDYLTLEGVYTTTGEEVLVGLLPNGLERYYCGVFVDQNGKPITPIYYIVNYSSGSYTKSSTVVDIKTLKPVTTTTGDRVLMGINGNGDEIRYCISEKTGLVEDITLSIYRREYDGRFVEIGSGLNNSQETFVTDPHPALDYARYRVVAISDKTGAVSFYDLPGYPIGEVAAIIQWDEKWSTFDVTEESEMQQPAWTGSLLRLPYNLDVSESSSVDVTNVEYIGRQHPVSYYGTQLGIGGSWNVDVPKSDKETIYGLRRLMIYTGDVYVREPSGVGYWATIKVSFGQTHCEVTVPVSLDITRVEGGV